MREAPTFPGLLNRDPNTSIIRLSEGSFNIAIPVCKTSKDVVYRQNPLHEEGGFKSENVVGVTFTTSRNPTRLALNLRAYVESEVPKIIIYERFLSNRPFMFVYPNKTSDFADIFVQGQGYEYYCPQEMSRGIIQAFDLFQAFKIARFQNPELQYPRNRVDDLLYPNGESVGYDPQGVNPSLLRLAHTFLTPLAPIFVRNTLMLPVRTATIIEKMYRIRPDAPTRVFPYDSLQHDGGDETISFLSS